MGWWSEARDILDPLGSYIKGPERAAEAAAAGTTAVAEQAELLNRERYEEATGRLDPYMASELRAKEQLDVEMGLAPGEAGTAYMQTPGYQGALDERLRAAEQTAVTGGGTAYGGRRIEAAAKAGSDVQSQYYSNYMNMLSSMADPSATTNISSLGMGQAATMGAQNIGAAQSAGSARMQGASATQATQTDLLGMAAKAIFM